MKKIWQQGQKLLVKQISKQASERNRAVKMAMKVTNKKQISFVNKMMIYTSKQEEQSDKDHHDGDK